MREIKFRAWNEEEKRMMYGDNIMEWKLDWLQSETTMQYTGLKDKNGVEVYEGDIVENADSGTYGEDWVNQYIAKIVFDNGCFIELPITKKTEYGYYSKNNWKVIGNIYENSELLK